MNAMLSINSKRIILKRASVSGAISALVLVLSGNAAYASITVNTKSGNGFYVNDEDPGFYVTDGKDSKRMLADEVFRMPVGQDGAPRWKSCTALPCQKIPTPDKAPGDKGKKANRKLTKQETEETSGLRPVVKLPSAIEKPKEGMLSTESRLNKTQSVQAAELGVMGVNLRDAVKFSYGFQGALQGAGTPNEAGLGAFIPIKVSKNSVFFIDAQANANFSDYSNYSDIINTTVAGTTISTSSRLGYRFLNSDRSWMFGVNAGYDSRPMATGPADTGVTVSNSQTVFFQQVAASLEAVSNTWNFNAYALVPIGTTNARLNSFYQGGTLDTYGLDVGYAITPDLKASLGYYYQGGDLNTADGSGVLGRLGYNISDGLTAGVNLSYDQAFETRLSADLKYRFGGNGNKNQSEKKALQVPVMKALTDNVKHRDVRVHDAATPQPEQPPVIVATSTAVQIGQQGMDAEIVGYPLSGPSVFCTVPANGGVLSCPGSGVGGFSQYIPVVSVGPSQ